MNYWQSAWRRWLVWTALVLAFAAACVLLSDWQFNRRAERLVEIQTVTSNYNAAPQEISTLLKVADVSELKWRPVTIAGRYLLEGAMLLRNRPLNGQPGFLQVIPFQYDGGLILIDRGWLPTGSLQDAPDLNPMPSDRVQTITVRLLPSEGDSGRLAPEGQLADLNLKKAAEQTGLKLNLEWYGREAGNRDLPKPLPKPSADEGNHLSYAIQWLVFGAMAFMFLVYSIRTELRYAKGAPLKRRESRADRDAAEEDQLLR